MGSAIPSVHSLKLMAVYHPGMVESPADCRAQLTLGVRNHEAKKIMKEKMKLGDQVQLALSLKEMNDDRCYSITVIVKSQVRPHLSKRLALLLIIGVFALATVAKEGYPDCKI
jgi:hypothetical protein